MGDHLYGDRILFDEPQAHARAFGTERHAGDGRHGGGLEALVVEGAAEKIQRRAGSIEQALLVVAMRLTKSFLDPGRAPLQLPQRLPAVIAPAAAERDRNRPL